jgi:very-short-patch-repair endonuclease
MDLRTLTDHASKHHGVVRRVDAARLGISKSAWYRAIDSGLLAPLYPNVARLPGAPETLPQRALAAVWATGAGALTSHRTSAALWGLPRPDDDPVEVLLSSRRRCVVLPGVVVHRPRDLVDLRPVLRDRVPTTMPVRMLLDLAAVEPDSLVDSAFALLARRTISPNALRAGLMRHARRGRNGITAFRELLDRMADERPPTDSELEVQMMSLLAAHGLPPVRFHPRVAGYEVDFLIQDSIIVLECDGWETHGLDRDQFEFDRIREADITAAGYVVVHFTWRRVTTQPHRVAEQIRASVRQWAPHLLHAA